MTPPPSCLRAYVVGACYTDVILHVDSYPKEDAKVRAQRVEQRRGGNGGNVLSVLSQYRPTSTSNATAASMPASSSTSTVTPVDHLSPANSAPIPGLVCEMVCVLAGDAGAASVRDSLILQDLTSRPGLGLTHALFRGAGYSEPTAWIIATPVSRTVVNHTTLPEMTHQEFADGCLRPPGGMEDVLARGTDDVWCHFEGRNVAEVGRMIALLVEMKDRHGRVACDGRGVGGGRRGSVASVSSTLSTLPPGIESVPGLLRKASGSSGSSNLANGGAGALGVATAGVEGMGLEETRPRLTISVEFEKMNRPGLEDLLPLADVCFFSKYFAEGKGFPGAPTGFLDNIRRKCKSGAILFVTWGENGAFGLINDLTRPPRTFHAPAPHIFSVDTIGAGDTFTAGCIYAMGARGLDAEAAANFGCKLATAKCAQVGFEGLAERVSPPSTGPSM
ncbi:hypothetical protein HK101_009978 [Irineochytrium annulatum]|nr:hypothetical protein HK101_009978 [Irineochytrium annulatum]